MKKMILYISLSLQLFSAESKVQVLSSDLRNLLSQEMQYIKSSMHKIFEAIISGDSENIVELATKIEHSYILKQKLTQEQKQEIKNKLSTKFIQYDKEFHATAQELASFAEFDDTEAIINTYVNMTKQCVKCHESFAVSRFPLFEEQE